MITHMQSVLLVERNSNLSELRKTQLDKYLQYEFILEIFHTLEEANKAILVKPYNLVLLDASFEIDDLIPFREYVFFSKMNMRTPVVLFNLPYHAHKTDLSAFDWAIYPFSQPMTAENGMQLIRTIQVFSGTTSVFHKTGEVKYSLEAGLKGKILLVDDDEVVLDLMASIISRKLGHSIDIDGTGDGIEAIDQINKKEYDLITTDIQHPGQNGYDVAIAARISDPNRHTPILLMSGARSPRNVGLFDLFLTKPLQVNEFVRAFRVLLGRAMPPLPEDILQPLRSEYERSQKRIQSYLHEQWTLTCFSKPISKLKERKSSHSERGARESSTRFDKSLKGWFYRYDGD